MTRNDSTAPPASSLPGLMGQAIARPVSVAAAVLLTIFFGVIAILDLPIQLTPDISQPTISVETTWPGASPLEVESEIIEEQEEVLKRVPGLQRMEATASANFATITLEFEVGTDLEQSLVRVSNALSQVPRYPDTAEQPVVNTASAAGPPLAVILVRHKTGGSVDPYRTWVEEEIVPQIERVGGIASTFMRGGRRTEVQVDFDTHALAARGLTVPDVATRIRAELRNASAGEMEVGKRNILVRTLVAPEKVEELGHLVLAMGPENSPVRLSDVADVKLGLRRATDFAIGDQRESIALLPRREAGSNVLEVTEAVRATVKELNEKHFAAEGLELEIVDDQTGYIYSALDQVQTNLLIGAALATVVLLLFLRSFGAAMVVALAIPVCVLATGLVMALFGRSVNVVSLAGITFAVGMVVDNSIVALENIDTWRHRLSDIKQAALRGIREVSGALLASTATTAAVFIPILVWEGEVGELLRDIALAISISVSLSLIVSVFVIPSFAAAILRSRANVTPRQPSLLVRLGQSTSSGITRLARWLAANTGRSLLVTAGAIAVAGFVMTTLLPKMEYLPTGNRNLVFGVVLPPPGLSIDELKRVGFENQKTMWEHTGREVNGLPAVQRSFFVGTPSLLFIGGVAEQEERVAEMRDFMRELHAQIPGAIGFATQAALFARGIGEGRAVQLEIRGNDIPTLIGLGGKLFGQLREAVPGSQVRPVPILDLGAPELHVFPNRAEARSMGVSPSDIGLIADAYIDGAILGEYGEPGERKLDVVLRNRASVSGYDDVALAAAPVALPNGSIVPFDVLADFETKVGPTVVQRIERQRAVILQLTPPDDVPFETAINEVRKVTDTLTRAGDVPAGVTLELSGTAGKLAEAQEQFAWILLVALVILYLLLAALFEDFVAPLVILTTVPLAAAGGVVGLQWSNLVFQPQPMDIVTTLGFLILFGVVVNNAILIVDGALARLREGDNLRDATSAAVAARVRPIFMSTLTSLAGLMPMVLTRGSGSELYRGIGTIVLGGLSVATVLSLFVVPSLFVLVWSLRTKAIRAATAS